jgi:hypothetical protein
MRLFAASLQCQRESSDLPERPAAGSESWYVGGGGGEARRQTWSEKKELPCQDNSGGS